MRQAVVAPSLGADSFHCPHCGALAHQTWFKVWVSGYEKDNRPYMPDVEVVTNIEADRNMTPELKKSLIPFFKKTLARKPFLDSQEQGEWHRSYAHNCYLSLCFSCKDIAIWVADQLAYPITTFAIEANADLPQDVRHDFKEAARIVNLSPRGAAPLLSLCIQKLCKEAGEKGRRIDDDIASLIAKGLSPQVQRALDVVRVIGNEAVHPGQIDLRDDKAIAVQLFELVNIIADALISQPKRTAALYAKLPVEKLEAIERRDAHQLSREAGTDG